MDGLREVWPGSPQVVELAVRHRTAENVLAALGTDRDKWWTYPEMVEKAGLGWFAAARLYPALGFLEDHGWVEGRFEGPNPRRRRYRITYTGYLSLLEA